MPAPFFVLRPMIECVTTELPFRLVGGLSTGGIYALVALGYTLVYGVLQLINFAHSEVFMGGSLAGFLFLELDRPGGRRRERGGRRAVPRRRADPGDARVRAASPSASNGSRTGRCAVVARHGSRT